MRWLVLVRCVSVVLLRLSPSVDPHTHLLTTTGVLDSKFGFSIETGAAERAIVHAMQLPHLDVVGVHFHLGSPLFETEPYEQAIEYTLAFVARMRDAHGFTLSEFSPGGGFAVPYTSDRVAPTPDEYAEVIASALKRSCAKHGLALPLLTVEPGRALVARAGVAVYAVGGIKHVEGVRTFVSVDGGMGDNIRPPLYDAKYSILSVSRPRAEPSQTVTIVGKFCESGDYLARDVHVAAPQVDDLIAMPCAGAYQVAMSSNYNAYCRPCVLFVRDGAARVVLRRERVRRSVDARCSVGRVNALRRSRLLSGGGSGDSGQYYGMQLSLDARNVSRRHVGAQLRLVQQHRGSVAATVGRRRAAAGTRIHGGQSPPKPIAACRTAPARAHAPAWRVARCSRAMPRRRRRAPTESSFRFPTRPTGAKRRSAPHSRRQWLSLWWSSVAIFFNDTSLSARASHMKRHTLQLEPKKTSPEPCY